MAKSDIKENDKENSTSGSHADTAMTNEDIQLLISAFEQLVALRDKEKAPKEKSLNQQSD